MSEDVLADHLLLPPAEFEVTSQESRTSAFCVFFVQLQEKEQSPTLFSTLNEVDIQMDDDEDDQYIGDIVTTNNQPKTFSLENLPAEFVAFLAKNEIDPAIYTVTDLPRYVRLNPDPHLTTTPQELERELGTRVEPVPGLEAFCRLNGSTKLRNCQAYVHVPHTAAVTA